MIKGFTGIDQPYEAPDAPEIVCKTVNRSVEECVNQIIRVLEENKILPKSSTKAGLIYNVIFIDYDIF